MKPNVKCAHTEIVLLSELKPHPDNENSHPERQIEALAKIIAKLGQRSPIVVSNRSGYITKGHGRLEAIKMIGWDSAAIDRQDYKDDLEELNDRVADNEIARYSEFQLDKFEINLKKFDLDIKKIDLVEFGILDSEIEVIEPRDDDDSVPEIKHDPVTKRGDVWLLGDHRVMCGDSTMIDDVDKLMKGEKADMVFTDPPYGMNLNPNYDSMFTEGKSKARNHRNFDKIKGDDEDYDPSFILSYFGYVKEIFLWGGDYYAERIVARNKGSWLAWDKTGGHDSLENIFGSHFEMCWMKQRHKRYVAHVTWKGMCGHNKKDDGANKVHPTQKPIKLAEWFFEKWCDGLIKCVDLYLGSGSTLIACEKTKRKCYGMELDERYCDVIIKRYLDYTKRDDVTLESTGEKYSELLSKRLG